MLLAYGAKLNVTDAEGKTPFTTSASYPTCQAKTSDGSDCPKTCAVLKKGVTADQAKAIKAGKQPDDQSRDGRKCCKDPKKNNRDYSECCV